MSPASETGSTEASFLSHVTPRSWVSWGFCGVVILIAAGLRIWNLPLHGWGNIYYAAAVRSMAASWHNFLYAAFDPAGFLSLDKPPVAFWFQASSVRLFGYSGFVLHLPQAIEGILIVALVYWLTRRVAGEWAGLLAGLAMAMTPASVAIDRSNLPDTCLLLVLVAAAWALLRASETGRWRWLLIAAALVGVGFNVKMMAAWVVLPIFYLTFFLAAPISRGKRAVQLGVATVVLVAVSLSWAVLFDLTPKPLRPYAGDSEDNSMLSLAIMRHGLARVAPGQKSPPSKGPLKGPPRFEQGGPRPLLGPPGMAKGGPQSSEITGHGGQPGLFRLAGIEMAGHITWLIPFAAIGLIAFALMSRPLFPLTPLHATVLLWCGWFVIHATVYSLPPTHIHPYYLTMLAPPVAALFGIGSVHLWRTFERGGMWAALPVAAILLTGAWQVWVLGYYPEWRVWLVPILLIGAAISALLLTVAARQTSGSKVAARLRIFGIGLGVAVLFVCPLFWSLTPVLAPGSRMVPLADPALLEHRSPPEFAAEAWADVRSLVEFLRANRRNERFLMATPNLHLAAPLIIATGEPVMPYGGYTGAVPTLSAERFAAMVERGEVRFLLLAGGRGPMGRMGPGPRRERPHEVDLWVRENGRKVPAAQWRTSGEVQARMGQPLPPWGPTDEMVGEMFRGPDVILYDCGGTTSTKAR